MVFSSIIFVLLFLPLTLALYFLPLGRGGFLRADWWKNSVLLVTSLFFYAWGEGIYVLAMIFCVVLNWASALVLVRFPAHRKAILATGVALNLLFLGYYKYAEFIYESLIVAIPSLAAPLAPYMKGIHLPIGVSFFTFQAMSYLVDVYRGDVKAQPNIAKLCIFKAFFPQLIAGPIVRYRDVAEQITDRRTSLRDFSYGAERFIAGLAQKAILANTLGQVADKIYELPVSEMNALFAWTAVVAYTFQIYYDFCGYSNMAIGMARMFGFHFLENFDHPYIAKSVTEFWRRWHISLSTWFRDYLYIPLGGNRRGPLITYRNLFIVFFLCGLWHGASWSFVIWGLFHGALLVIERTAAGRAIERLPSPFRHAYTLLAVMIGWVFFRVESLGDALAVLGRMFGLSAATAAPKLLYAELVTPEVIFCAIAATIFAAPLPLNLGWFRRSPRLDEAPLEPTPVAPPGFVLAAQLTIFVFALGYLAAGTFNPFIYFRF